MTQCPNMLGRSPNTASSSFHGIRSDHTSVIFLSSCLQTRIRELEPSLASDTYPERTNNLHHRIFSSSDSNAERYYLFHLEERRGESSTFAVNFINLVGSSLPEGTTGESAKWRDHLSRASFLNSINSCVNISDIMSAGKKAEKNLGKQFLAVRLGGKTPRKLEKLLLPQRQTICEVSSDTKNTFSALHIS